MSTFPVASAPLNRTYVERRVSFDSTSGAPWSKKNDGSKSTTGGPTSGGKIKR